MARHRRIAPLLLAACISAPAHAAVVSSTQITYYSITGNSPQDIFRAILSRGPRVSGAQAIASISTSATQDAGLDDSGAACRLKDYTIKLDFIITRPRIDNPGVLSAQDRANWDQMNSFIIAHEDQHKQTWLSCAEQLDKQLSPMTAPNCDKLLSTGGALWQQMLDACGNRQSAFDDIQASQLEALPFMQRARNGAN